MPRGRTREPPSFSVLPPLPSSRARFRAQRPIDETSAVLWRVEQQMWMRRRRLAVPRREAVDVSCEMTRASQRERDRWRRKVRAYAKKEAAARSEFVDERGHYIAPPSLEYMLLRGIGDDPSIEIFDAELMAEASAATAAIAHAHAAMNEAARQQQVEQQALQQRLLDEEEEEEADAEYWSYWDAEINGTAAYGLSHPERPPHEPAQQSEQPHKPEQPEKQNGLIDDGAASAGGPDEVMSRWVPSRPPSQLHHLIQRHSCGPAAPETQSAATLASLTPHPPAHDPPRARRPQRGVKRPEVRAPRAERAAMGGGHGTRMDLRTTVIDQREPGDDSRYSEAVRKHVARDIKHARGEASQTVRARLPEDG